MCNAYNTAKDPKKISVSAFDGLATRLIRRTDQAPVVLSGGEVASMRWGFERRGLGVVNNTRSDNLESRMWKDSYEKRRCLVPLLSYYEWSGPKGNKRTHLFKSPTPSWLFAAGLWEESRGWGPCFSMLTTEANSLVSPYHHRMPAILTESEQKLYLEFHLEGFAPDSSLLIVEDSVNPLLKNPPTHIQEELF